MSGEVVIGSADDARLAPHAFRSAILGEVHARPFTSILTPARVLHFAFDTAQERSQTDRVTLGKFCERLGQAAPALLVDEEPPTL